MWVSTGKTSWPHENRRTQAAVFSPTPLKLMR